MKKITDGYLRALSFALLLLFIFKSFFACAPKTPAETGGDGSGTGEPGSTDMSVMNEFYVSTTGSDSGSGTKDDPFLTLEKARDTVRSKNRDMTGDIVIHVGEGVFELDDTFELTAEDSGSNGFSVIYNGAGRDKTHISGGVGITGWTLHDAENNIYAADVPDGLDFRQLYVDGKRAVRARSGKIGEYRTRILGAERIRNGQVLPELLTVNSADSRAQADDGTVFISTKDGTFDSSWKNQTDIELHIFAAWTVNILRIKSAEADGDQYRIKIADEEAELIFNRQHPNIDGYSYMNTRRFIYYVENAYELIDEDNEWYFDRAEGKLYYKAPKGVDPNGKQITAPRLENIVRVKGTLDDPVHDVQFTDISFEYSNWLKPTEEGFVDAQAMQYVTRTVFSANDTAVGRPAAGILLTGAQNVVFDNDKIANMGATGIDLFWGTDHCTVSNCEISDISGNGVSVGRFTQDEDVDDHVPYNPSDKREICTDDMIVNNVITRVGVDYESGIGIAAGYPKNILIANNTVSYAPYTGISIGFGWTKSPNAMGGNRILRNEIHHVTTMLCDAGGIYTLSEQPGSMMRQNYIHDIALSRWADYSTWGIYLDEGTGGYLVTENIVEKAYDVNLHATGENKVWGNFVNTNAEVTGERADEIKALAGVTDSFDAEKLLADMEKTGSESFGTEVLFEDDFEEYGAGIFESEEWTVPASQKSLVSIVEEDGGKFLRIDGAGPNTKVNYNGSFDSNVTTFDFMFPENLSGFLGMYNVVRRTNIDYTCNITPAYTTTVRIEAKSINEVGVHKDIRYKTWYTCRTMVLDGTIYMKIWEAGTDEPEDWDVIKDMQNAVVGDCMLGLEFGAPSGKYVYVDNVVIETVKR